MPIQDDLRAKKSQLLDESAALAGGACNTVSALMKGSNNGVQGARHGRAQRRGYCHFGFLCPIPPKSGQGRGQRSWLCHTYSGWRSG